MWWCYGRNRLWIHNTSNSNGAIIEVAKNVVEKNVDINSFHHQLRNEDGFLTYPSIWEVPFEIGCSKRSLLFIVYCLLLIVYYLQFYVCLGPQSPLDKR